MISLNPKKVLNDAALLWAGQIGGIVVSVAAGIMLTRELGPDARGVYSWLLATVALGSMFAMCGFDGINRRYGGAQPEALSALMRLNALVVGGVGGVLSLGLLVWALNTSAAGTDGWAIGLAMLALVPMALQTALGPLLLTQNRVGRAAALNFYPKLAMAVGVMALLVWGVADVRNALMVNLLAAGLGMALLVSWLAPAWRQASPVKLKALARQIGWAGGGSLFLAGIAQFYMQKLDVVMMGLMLTSKDVGFYAVASNMADIMVTPASAVAGILAARLAGQHHHNGVKNLIVMLSAAVVAGAGLVYLISPWILPLLYGPAFTPAVPLLQALCPAVVALSLFYILQACLAVVGRLRWLALPPLVGLGVNIVLNLVWMPTYGAMGAAYASGAAYTVAALLAGVLLWRVK